MGVVKKKGGLERFSRDVCSLFRVQMFRCTLQHLLRAACAECAPIYNSCTNGRLSYIPATRCCAQRSLCVQLFKLLQLLHRLNRNDNRCLQAFKLQDLRPGRFATVQAPPSEPPWRQTTNQAHSHYSYTHKPPFPQLIQGQVLEIQIIHTAPQISTKYTSSPCSNYTWTLPSLY